MRPGTSHPARDRKRRLRSEVNDGALCQTVNLISEMSKLVPLLRVLLVDANSINLNIVRPFIRAAQAVMSASPVTVEDLIETERNPQYPAVAYDRSGYVVWIGKVRYGRVFEWLGYRGLDHVALDRVASGCGLLNLDEADDALCGTANERIPKRLKGRIDNFGHRSIFGCPKRRRRRD